MFVEVVELSYCLVLLVLYEFVVFFVLCLCVSVVLRMLVVGLVRIVVKVICGFFDLVEVKFIVFVI